MVEKRFYFRNCDRQRIKAKNKPAMGRSGQSKDEPGCAKALEENKRGVFQGHIL